MRRNEDYPSYYYKDIEGTAEIGLERSAGEPFRELKVYGESVQNGTPSPGNPIKVESVGEKTPQLLNLPTSGEISWHANSSGLAPKGIRNPDGSITFDGVNGDDVVKNMQKIFGDSEKMIIEETGVYAFSCKNASSAIYMTCRLPNGSGGFAYQTIATSSRVVYATIEQGTEITVYLQVGKNASVSNLTLYPMMQKVDAEGDAVSDFEPYGYKADIEVMGKNLLDVRTAPIVHTNAATPSYRWERTETGFKGNFLKEYNKNSLTFGYIIGKTEELKGKTLTVSFETAELISGARCVIGAHIANVEGDKSNNFEEVTNYKPGYVGISGINVLITNNTSTYATQMLMFTVPEDADSETYPHVTVRFYLAMNDGLVPEGTTFEYKGIQVEIGETEGVRVNGYESYQEPIHSTIYLKEPIRKIGDYADEIDVIDEKTTRNIFEYVFTGEETWVNPFGGLDTTIRSYAKHIIMPRIRDGYSWSGFSEKGIFDGKSTGGTGDVERCQFSNMSDTFSAFYARILKSRCADLENPAKSDFTNIYTPGTKVYGVRETPIEETILLSDEIKTLKRNCQLRVKTSLSPSKVKAQYYRY